MGDYEWNTPPDEVVQSVSYYSPRMLDPDENNNSRICQMESMFEK